MLSGSFLSAGGASQTSADIALPTNVNNQNFTLSLVGVTGSGATVTLQRSYDNGATWGPVLPAYTADAQDRGVEPIQGTLYRLAVTGFSSGTIKYWLG